MDEHGDRTSRTSGMTTWRAGCSGSCTSGSEGGPEKPTSRKADRALRSDPYERHEAFPNRAVVKGHGLRLVAAGRLKLRAA
jgi:hypothetical protein